MKVKISDLRAKIIELMSVNYTEEEAEKVADYLVWADMCGIDTQGVIKMAGGTRLQSLKPEAAIETVRDTKLSRLLNAHSNPAPLVTQIGAEAAIEKAKEHGFGMVGINGTFSSNGALAYYTQKIAKQDLIGVVLARSPGSTTAFDSIDPLFGTNPISFAFPTTNDPIVFDMATSAMTFFGLVLAKAQGQDIPDDMAIDEYGNPTTDPDAAMSGAILPFDRGYKSSGLGMIVEMMGGPLVGASFIDSVAGKGVQGKLGGEKGWGTLILAISPDLLVDTDQYKQDATEFVNRIKASRKKSGIEEIRLPGERAAKAHAAAKKEGLVEIDDAVLKEIGWDI